MKQPRTPLLAITLGALVLSGCVSAPLTRDASQLQQLPDSYASGGKGGSLSSHEKWWKSFRRGDLNRLEANALRDNLDLQQAWARLRQSEAAARQAGASLYPQLDAGGTYQRTWRDSSPTGNTATSFFEAGASAGYEIDLWGKIRSGRSAAEAEAGATAADLQATALTISAGVADRWVEIIESRQQLSLLDRQLKTNRTQLELVELRFQNSQASSLDVLQQRQTVARTQSQVPTTEAQLELSRHALNFLLGKPAGEAVSIDWERIPSLPPLPATGVPSDLLAQRPDVRAALMRIEAADWNVAAARADRLPSIGISAGAAGNTNHFEDIFDDWLANFAGRLTAPILDGGRRRLEVEKQLAVVDQAIAAYRDAVLRALKEVEDALVFERKVRERLSALEHELGLARTTLGEARNRYANGLSDYLNVTAALVTMQNLERDQITAASSVFKARIALHRALGGKIL